MNKKIAVIPGDGIGPEVTNQSVKVLDAIAKRFGHQFDYHYAVMGAIAIDQTGNPLPDTTIETCLQSDAILFGAIGDPKYDNDPAAKVRPEQGLLKLRKVLQLYAYSYFYSYIRAPPPVSAGIIITTTTKIIVLMLLTILIPFLNIECYS